MELPISKESYADLSSLEHQQFIIPQRNRFSESPERTPMLLFKRTLIGLAAALRTFLSSIWQFLALKAGAAPRRYQIIVGGAAIVVFFLQLCLLYNPKLAIHDVSRAAQNETLGFAKAFYISLPYRTDRQDAMELLGATSNVKLTYQPGILGTEMNPKAQLSDGGFLRPEQWGCWRSHADAWKRVVDEKLETALIMEDDVDWDANVHDVFEELSRQMRNAQLLPPTMTAEEQKSAPYGLDWDVLYVGTCYNIPADPRPKYIAYTDPNAPTRANMTPEYAYELEGWVGKVDNNTHARVIAPSWYPICTIGYAVTQRGAQRLLYNTGGVKPIGSAVDLAMTDQIKKGHVRGYTIVPPLINAWKVGGIQDSDIDDMKEKEKELEEGEKLAVGSANLLRSARERMNAVLGDVYPGTITEKEKEKEKEKEE